MANEPQNSLAGANARTSVPQTMRSPTMLNPVAMNQQIQTGKVNGAAPAQAVNNASMNANTHYYAKGGQVPAPTVDQMHSTDSSSQEIDKWAKLLSDTPALKPMSDKQKATSSSSDETSTTNEDYIHQYSDPQYLKDRANMPKHYAKGGDVAHMPLKELVKMLANHPDVMNQGRLSASGPQKSTDMAKGGMPTANTQGKSEARSHGKGILTMNDDAGNYAEGGEVNPYGNMEGKGILKLAAGGDMEVDNITSYGPDGMPMIKNEDGTQGYGDINKLLGRPEGISKNASNSISNKMATGGEEEGNQPPPGSLKAEVADDVPAKLSGGEFVFSADVVRFYGLRTLNMMMEHARNALQEMNEEGTIRHPGDGKNKPTNEEGGGQFVQDAQPDIHAYDEDEDMDNGEEDAEGAAKVSGLLKECMGGGIGMATGGGVGEEQSLAKGGEVRNTIMEAPYGRSNMVSSHPKGGAVLQDYAKGGVVTSSSSNLFPKKSEGLIPSGESKIPGLKKSFSHAKAMPKMKEGGLLDNVNANIFKETHESQMG